MLYMQNACMALQINAYFIPVEMRSDKLKIVLNSDHQDHEKNPSHFC